MLRRLEIAAAAGRYVPPYPIAVVHAALNEREQAFVWPERAYKERDSVNYLGLDPRLDGLRDDPHFTDLMGRLKLPLKLPKK